MAVLVVYESPRGKARRAVDAIAEAAAAHGLATLIRRVDEVEAAHIESAEALIAGCWTPGKVPFGDRTVRRMARWVEELPQMADKPIGLFCTYKFFPRTFADTATRTAETLQGLGRRFEEKGAQVVATRSINMMSIDEEATVLVDRLLQHLPQG